MTAAATACAWSASEPAAAASSSWLRSSASLRSSLAFRVKRSGRARPASGGRKDGACSSVHCTMASSTVASKRSKDRWNRCLTMLREFEEACATPVDFLWSLVDEMVEEMQAGLDMEGGGKMRMLLTFVDNLPDGNEQGTYYALDLGGTNFRVLRVQLGENQKIGSKSREVAIPPELMHGTNEELFDFIAHKLAEFANEEDESPSEQLELGFTFSFPIHQTSISSGYLINWTKGFSVPDTVGKDVVEELEAAISRQGLDMRVAALVNDTVGTLARGRYNDEDVVVSVILGTGTNACYVERADVIPKYKNGNGEGLMVINTEWGCSWSDRLPKADVDEELDAESINPGDQYFEKLVSGMYLGEILRRLLLKMAQEAQLFGDTVPAKLKKPYVLQTPMMSKMHEDGTSDLQEVNKVLSEVIGVKDAPLEVRKLVVDACEVIAARAARLAGAGIVGLLKKIGKVGKRSSSSSSSRTNGSSRGRRAVVAIDGGLYDRYPAVRRHVKQVVEEMLGADEARTISIELSRDGSGVGAALIAACARKNTSNE